MVNNNLNKFREILLHDLINASFLEQEQIPVNPLQPKSPVLAFFSLVV